MGRGPLRLSAVRRLVSLPHPPEQRGELSVILLPAIGADPTLVLAVRDWRLTRVPLAELERHGPMAVATVHRKGGGFGQRGPHLHFMGSTYVADTRYPNAGRTGAWS